MKQEITVVIVDDHPLLRVGLGEVMKANPEFHIIGEASDGEEALHLFARLKPQIAIIDIDMPKRNGLETLRAMRELSLAIKPIMLTMYREEDMFNAAMDLGAKAYVLKDNAADDILMALAAVARGDAFVSPSMLTVAQRRSDRVRELLMGKPQIESLTPAERRILKLVGEDYTSKEIAGRLHLSVRTVDNHRQHICDKLKLHGTHSLLKFAFDNSAYL